MASPIFIVSTGRCGSTLLSNIVRQHPQIASISEFFTSLSSIAFRGKTLTGPAIANRLATLSPAGKALHANAIFVDEFLYPLAEGRYSATEVPPILCTTLPHLADQPDALWDELRTALEQRPASSVAEHYRFVFDWLTSRLGRTVWFERSGASLNWVVTLADWFPDARFIHIHRDGRDTALSMQKHPYFRLRTEAAERMRSFGMDPFSPFNSPGTSPWIPFFERLRFSTFSKTQYDRIKLPLAAFGRFWSAMICLGLKHLGPLGEDRLLSMSYETLVESPRSELEKMIQFVDPSLADSSWLDAASALPTKRPPSWHRLSREEHDALADACREGQELLGYDNAYSK